MKVSRRVWLGFGLVLGAGAVMADPAPTDPAGPDLELLEYLGGLVSDDDKWVGPDDMQGVLDTKDREAFPDDGPATAEVDTQ
jgi:hypothetical protein